MAVWQGSPEQQLILPLLVLICQQRDATEITADAKDIKFISEQYDMTQQAFLQVRTYTSDRNTRAKKMRRESQRTASVRRGNKGWKEASLCRTAVGVSAHGVERRAAHGLPAKRRGVQGALWPGRDDSPHNLPAGVGTRAASTRCKCRGWRDRRVAAHGRGLGWCDPSREVLLCVSKDLDCEDAAWQGVSGGRCGLASETARFCCSSRRGGEGIRC